MHQQSDAAPFCDEVGEVFGALFLKKSALSGKYRMLPYFSRLGPARSSISSGYII